MTSDDHQPVLEETLRSRFKAAIPPAPSVLGWAHHAATKARRRRVRRRQALAVVSASCVAAAVTIGTVSFDDSEPSPDRAPGPAVAASTPQPPPGTRFVGLGSVVVAVPDSWQIRIGGCYDLTEENAVVLPSQNWITCAGVSPRPDVSLLRILPTDAADAEGLLEVAQPAGEINGIAVLRTPTEESDQLATSALIVPDADGIFWLEAPDAAGVERIFDTLMSLPNDYVALPSAQTPWPCVRTQLAAVGMVVEVREAAAPGLPNGAIIDSEPMLGTVVERGTTVVLTVPSTAPDAAAASCP